MRTAALALALAAFPFATPSFAAGSMPSSDRQVAACNSVADQHGVTGYARSKFVQRCFERQSSGQRPMTDRTYRAG